MECGPSSAVDLLVAVGWLLGLFLAVFFAVVFAARGVVVLLKALVRSLYRAVRVHVSRWWAPGKLAGEGASPPAPRSPARDGSRGAGETV